MFVRAARPGDAASIARVHVDTWRTTYRGIVPDHVLDGLSYAAREQLWSRLLLGAEQDRHSIFVAADGQGRIAGFASGGPEREGDPQYKGELYGIYVRKENQGQGLGRLLTAAVARCNLQAGFTSMLLWVLAANPACAFYAHLGGRPVKTRQVQIGGAALDELAYGWDNVAPLVSRPEGNGRR